MDPSYILIICAVIHIICYFRIYKQHKDLHEQAKIIIAESKKIVEVQTKISIDLAHARKTFESAANNGII